ncbi:MAG: hypothetical protein Crog4KO_04720 [Crocinitomicaceae bacterium]
MMLNVRTVIVLILFSLMAFTSGAAKGTLILKIIDLAGDPIPNHDINIKGKGSFVSNSDGIVFIEKVKDGKMYELESGSSIMYRKYWDFRTFPNITSDTAVITIKWSSKGWELSLPKLYERDQNNREKLLEEIDFTQYSPCDDSTGEHHILNMRFPGGNALLGVFLMENINYPIEAIENEDSGLVVVSFIISEKGTLENIYLDQSNSASLDAEAIRLIEMIDNWLPPTCNGKPLSTTVRIPINFKVS